VQRDHRRPPAGDLGVAAVAVGERVERPARTSQLDPRVAVERAGRAAAVDELEQDRQLPRLRDDRRPGA
jgi:hypothetical protein